VLAKAPLESLHLQGASSWCQQDMDFSDRLATLRLIPGSLRLTKLEMDNCSLRKVDMQVLLNAATSLRSLLYWTGPRNFTASDLIELIGPLKDALEELYLEVMPFWPDREEEDESDGRLSTLSHLTALKVLDTTPEMWECLVDERNNQQPIDDKDLLCHRLPPNIERLIFHPPRDLEEFHDGSTPDVPDKRQIEDVIFKYSESLPHLQEIFIGSAFAKHGFELEQSLQKHRRNLDGVKLIIGTSGRADPAPTRSVFDGILPSSARPKTQWNGTKYCVVHVDRDRVF
jgi:hypothetical protein